MKFVKYIIAPSMVALLFASCANEAQGPSQAELDTQVEAKVKAATDQLKADCDGRMLQAAQMQADSLLAKMVTPKPAPAPKPSPAPAPKNDTKIKTPTTKPEVKTNPKDDRFSNGGGKKVTTEDTKAKNDRFENGGKKEVTPADTKRKDERFK